LTAGAALSRARTGLQAPEGRSSMSTFDNPFDPKRMLH
jgi:hypothetical protein